MVNAAKLQPASVKALPKTVTIRRGTEVDEIAAFEVMRRAMGYEMSWHHHASSRKHLRTTRGSSFWLAEEASRFGGPKAIGYARSIVRDAVWCLTEFFVLPVSHRKGIGRALLLHCVEDGAREGANARLVLASTHPSAEALYIRMADCIPRLPMLLLSGDLSRLPPLPEDSPRVVEERSFALFQAGLAEPTAQIVASPLTTDASTQIELATVDRDVVGYARPEEHAFWQGQMAPPEGIHRVYRHSHGANAGGICGYGYLGRHFSGPFLATEPAYLPAFIAHLANLYRGTGSQSSGSMREPQEHYIAIAGTNGTVLRWLLSAGWQISFQYLFMSSRSIGQLDRYVCHNPLYVL